MTFSWSEPSSLFTYPAFAKLAGVLRYFFPALTLTLLLSCFLTLLKFCEHRLRQRIAYTLAALILSLSFAHLSRAPARLDKALQKAAQPKVVPAKRAA